MKKKGATVDSSRLLNVADSSGWRYQFVSLADKDKEALESTRDHPQRVAARRALWRAASKANGARSAAELTWQGLDANIPTDSFEIAQEASDNSNWETATTTSTGSSTGSWTSVSGDDSDSA